MLPPLCVCGGVWEWREKESALESMLERKPGIQWGHKVLSKSSGRSSKNESVPAETAKGAERKTVPRIRVSGFQHQKRFPKAQAKLAGKRKCRKRLSERLWSG